MPDVKQIVKRSGLLLDRLIPPPDGITILIYHRVGAGMSLYCPQQDDRLFPRRFRQTSLRKRIVSRTGLILLAFSCPS